LPHGNSVDKHCSVGSIEQPWNETDKRRLSAACASNERNRLSCFDLQIYIAEHRLVIVRKSQIAKFDRTLYRRLFVSVG
jgi:hypothetical protein